MVYSLAYRRPERVSRPSSAASISGETKQKSIQDSVHSGSSGMSHGIPEALSFDKIISGGVCPVRKYPIHLLGASLANLHGSPALCATS
jgi:hypothetical protein